jgi:general secretion pathway protein I
MRSYPESESGFTILEMLVALSVLSIAVLALVNLAGETIRNAGTIEDRMFANVVAENRAVEALTQFNPPAIGVAGGTETSANRTWRWTRKVSLSPDPEILRVDIDVTEQEGGQVLGAVTVFRGRQ